MSKFCCNNIDDFLDGELSVRDSKRFHASIKTCEDCREVLRQQGQIDALLRAAWQEVHLPVRVRKELVQQTPALDHQPKYRMTMLIAVAVCLMISLGILSARFLNSPTEQLADSDSRDPRILEQADTSGKPPMAVDVTESGSEELKTIVTFDSRSLGVVDEISDSTFTLVHVYPTVNASSSNLLKGN